MRRATVVRRRLAVAMIAVVMTVTVIAAALACGAKATPTSTPTPVNTPAVYERFLAALTATAGASPVEAPAVPPASPVHRYPFEVIYRDFELPINEETVFHRLLSLAPDTPDTRAQVWLNDLNAFWGLWERVGVERPTAEDGAEAYREGFRAVISKLKDAGISPIDLPMPDSAPWISGFGDRSYTETVNFFPYAGIDVRNADSMFRSGQGWSLGFSTVPGASPETLEIVLGRYDAAAIGTAIERCSDCVPFDAREHGGTRYMAWGQDFQQSLQNRLGGPFHDSIGRGGRVAAFDGAMYRALSTEGIEQLIDARSGLVPNLGRDPDYQVVAAGLTALDAHTAILSSTDFSFFGLERNMSTICIALDNRAYSGSSRPIAAEQGGSSGSANPSACTTSGRPGSVGWAPTSRHTRQFLCPGVVNV